VDKEEALSRFLFELGQLKKIPRSGWLRLGIDDPESVAAHSFRTATIGFILAKGEGLARPELVATHCLFHDLGEARTGDLDKVAQEYLGRRRDEGKPSSYLDRETIRDQVSALEEDLGQAILALFEEEEIGEEISIVARDADHLELMVQAVEYYANGHRLAQEWVESVNQSLRTSSAKAIGAKLVELSKDPGELERALRWWKST